MRNAALLLSLCVISLGEGYEKANARNKAIASYRRSLELNPDNTHATKQLKLMAGTQD